MADNDAHKSDADKSDTDKSLEKYLSDLGIDTGGDTRPAAPPAPFKAPSAATTDTHGSQSRTAEDSTAKNSTAKNSTAKNRVDGDFGTERERGKSNSSAALVTGSSLERCEAFLVDLLLNLDPGYAAEVAQPSELELRVDIVGGDPGKIIGRGGRTLAALEYLTNAVLNKDEGVPHIRVSVDVGGYKARRDERLRGVALKAAARARKTGFAVELEPMSAAERRVIHMTLADDPAIKSESSGEGRERRVVVKPL